MSAMQMFAMQIFSYRRLFSAHQLTLHCTILFSIERNTYLLHLSTKKVKLSLYSS